MVAGTYPSLSHIVMTSRSSASDASARTLRSTLGDTSSQDRLFNKNYEELKACDLSVAVVLRTTRSVRLMRHSDLRRSMLAATSARQLGHIALLVINAPMSSTHRCIMSANRSAATRSAAPFAAPALCMRWATATYCSLGPLRNCPPSSCVSSSAMPPRSLRDCFNSIPGLCGSPPPGRSPPALPHGARLRKPTSHKL